MSGPTAGEALEYAMGEEYLKLYGVTCTGVLFALLAGVGLVRGGGAGLAVLFLVFSPAIVLLGLVATFYKLLEESA